MKAVIFHEFQGSITVESVENPTPSDHGVVIEVKATGLCRSDWHGWMGHDPDIKLPHVPGHELAGIVSAVGKNVQRVKVGDRVTTPFVCGCGFCPQCISGNHQVCDHQSQPGFTHWGSFAEFVAIDYADTACVATLCAQNEYVLNHVCTACPSGKSHVASADASGSDTVCSESGDMSAVGIVTIVVVAIGVLAVVGYFGFIRNSKGSGVSPSG